jgi:hypothetical protein
MLGQRAIVVYKKGFCGHQNSNGLGNSQLKELQHLQEVYYRDGDKGHAFLEIDATEFETANTLNRAQIYRSATQGMLQTHGTSKVRVILRSVYFIKDTNQRFVFQVAKTGSKSARFVASKKFVGQMTKFLEQLSYKLLMDTGDQFRIFDSSFLEEKVFPAHSSSRLSYPIISWRLLIPFISPSGQHGKV